MLSLVTLSVSVYHIRLNILVLCITVLSVVMLIDVMLNVVAPKILQTFFMTKIFHPFFKFFQVIIILRLNIKISIIRTEKLNNK
jgi:hypothetical protein